MAMKDAFATDCTGQSVVNAFTSHYVQDKAFKDEGLRHPFNSAEGFPNAEQLVDQFLNEAGVHNAPQSFRMDSLLQEMREIESSNSFHAPVQAPGVAVLATADPTGIASDHLDWVEQYLEDGNRFNEEPNEDAVWNTVAPFEYNPNGETYEFGFGPNWAQDYLDAQETTWNSVSGSLDEPTEDSDEVKEMANELLKSVDDDDEELQSSKFMKFMHQLGEGELKIQSGQVVANDSIEKMINLWTSDYFDLDNSSDERQTSAEFSGNADKLWKEVVHLMEGKDEARTETDKAIRDFKFTEDNPMKDCLDALEKGKEKLKIGDLIGAILCFEAACAQDPNSAEAWLYLGTSHAENEQDPVAIDCLLNALKLEPNNLKALMALSVSFTNETQPNRACYMLEKWLLANPKYSKLVANRNPDVDLAASGIPALLNRGFSSPFLKSEYFEMIKDLYIDAARMFPNDVDPDVQTGLGVLFNLNHEIDKAADCLRTALQVRQTDFELWNRLGAILANGGRPEEAVHAYREALQLNPGYVRARYNLGITCCSLQALRESAEHFLLALNQQASVYQQTSSETRRNLMSDNIWSSLKMVLSLGYMPELIQFVDKRDLEALKNHFGI